MLDLVVHCARVSNPNQNEYRNKRKTCKVFNKACTLVPEMVNACMEITTTRDIAHTIVRHRSFVFPRLAPCYAHPEDLRDMFIFSEARLQDEKNRQNSISVEDKKLQQEWEWSQMRIAHMAKKEYDWAIKKGIAKEQAPKCCPKGPTKTTTYEWNIKKLDTLH